MFQRCKQGAAAGKIHKPSEWIKKKTKAREGKVEICDVYEQRSTMWKPFLLRVTLLRNWLIVGRAVDVERGGKKWRYVWDDRHQRAAHRALTSGCHGDDDVVLVPHMEGIRVGVDKGRWHVQRAESLRFAFFFHVLIDWAQQTVCGQIEKEGWEIYCTIVPNNF